MNLAPLRIAELQEQIDKLGLKQTVRDTVTSIIVAYRTLQQAQEQLRLAHLSEARTRALIETNKALIAAGRMAAADLVQTQSDAANQEVAVLQAEQTRNSAQLGLLRLLAVNLRTDVRAGDPIKADHVVIDLEQAIAVADGNRMDLLSQRKARAQDRQSLKVAQNNRLWNLSVAGSYQRQRGVDSIVTPGQSPVVEGRNSSIGLQFSIPLGDYGYRQAYISATTALRTAELQVDELEQQIEASVRDAAQGVELSWRQRLTAHEAERLAAQALEVAREKLKAGRASNFETISYEVALRAADSQTLAADISYAASKHAVKGYVDSLRIELRRDKVPVSITLVKPSGVGTPLDAHATNHRPGRAMIPPPVYSPELVADAILHAAKRPTRERLGILVGLVGLAASRKPTR